MRLRSGKESACGGVARLTSKILPSPHPQKSALPTPGALLPGRRKIKNKLIAKNKGERPKTGESMAAAQGSAQN